MRLLDTPGPNEYGQDALRYRVERLLEGVDAVVYVLDYTKLKTRQAGLGVRMGLLFAGVVRPEQGGWLP